VYERFYKFSGIPFQLTPDHRFFFSSSGHARAIAHLVYGLSQEEGFIVITGEVGAGKTTLVEHLWTQLDRNTYVTSRVVTTQVAGDDLLKLVLANFGLETSGMDKAALLGRFESLAREQQAWGRRLVLVVDEVQNLSLAALEELRMLSNITVDGKASVQTILLGQPQFRQMLARGDTEQLRQRVLASYHLGPITGTETRSYIEHRLRTVGWTGDPHWDDAAFDAVYSMTNGIPRRINTLCSRVLLLGALEETHVIDADMVESTAAELREDLGGGMGASAPAVPTPPASAAARASGTPNVAEYLLRRIQAVEAGVTRQDKLFRRVIDLLSTYVEPER
jgi:putative secretion ATPase (PEP-CTERM system associated)